ncbi:MAG TPA: extracellular solute-binding protein [Steroidobacteraceae bacterium]|jgi:molybdenum ABC transporter molybdate-binding protein|nr:extracellular solute-binding protein [Steroidobacteraceae bacterium]
MIRSGLVTLIGLAVSGMAVAQTEPVTVQIFAAGSLRGVVSQLANQAASRYHVEVKATFGGSGTLRERIEKGASPDLFMSADVASPRKLAQQGRSVVPAIAFARNRLCIFSRRAAGVTAGNVIDRMLSRAVRIRTSTPLADPAGDYAWALFDRVDALRPGSGAVLKAKAQALMSITATPSVPGQSATAALFASNKIDMSIAYCSGAAALEKEVPGLSSLSVPPQLDPHPLYGVAVLSNKPQAQRLALFLLSEQGQAIVEKQGLVPLTQSASTQPAATP